MTETFVLSAKVADCAGWRGLPQELGGVKQWRGVDFLTN
ncbi:hypothetical protein HNQ57_000155 [Zhongshania antarctica]|uniref:Uncharacterized protein n=1 Tax=Zhongshania antarctica TaxID=641702 RepID=A0A840R010_9GAMM|nr:hypothetical protein [Zhongshania antarctica]